MADRPMKSISGLPRLEEIRYTFLQNDPTLSVSGKAADAKAAGDKIGEIKSDLTFNEYLINNGTYTIKVSDLESGLWSYSTKESLQTRARTKNLLPVRAGMTISYVNTTFDVYFGVLETPTSSTYIQLPGWKTDGSGTVNITNDGWLTFVIRNHADNTANVDPSDFDSVVTIATTIATTITGAIAEFEMAYRYAPGVDLFWPGNRYNTTNRGVTFTWNADKTACTVDGTNDGTGTAGDYFLGGTNVMPNGIQAGKKYHVKYKTTNNNVKLGVYYYTGEGTYTGTIIFTGDGTLNVPADATGLYFLIYVASGVSVSSVVASDMALYEVEAADISEVANLQSQIDEIWAYLRNQ